MKKAQISDMPGVVKTFILVMIFLLIMILIIIAIKGNLFSNLDKVGGSIAGTGLTG